MSQLFSLTVTLLNHIAVNKCLRLEFSRYIGGLCDTCKGGMTCSQCFRGNTLWIPKCTFEGNTKLNPNKHDTWPRFIRVVIGDEWWAFVSTVMNIQEFLE